MPTSRIARLSDAGIYTWTTTSGIFSVADNLRIIKDDAHPRELVELSPDENYVIEGLPEGTYTFYFNNLTLPDTIQILIEPNGFPEVRLPRINPDTGNTIVQDELLDPFQQAERFIIRNIRHSGGNLIIRFAALIPFTPEPRLVGTPTLSLLPRVGGMRLTYAYPTESSRSSIDSWQYSHDGGGYVTIPNSAHGQSNATRFTLTGLEEDIIHTFQVRAINDGGASPASHLESARTLPTPVAPSAPTSLTAVAGNGNVMLSWSGSTGTITGYTLRFSTQRLGTPGAVIITREIPASLVIITAPGVPSR